MTLLSKYKLSVTDEVIYIKRTSLLKECGDWHSTVVQLKRRVYVLACSVAGSAHKHTAAANSYARPQDAFSVIYRHRSRRRLTNHVTFLQTSAILRHFIKIQKSFPTNPVSTTEWLYSRFKSIFSELKCSVRCPINWLHNCIDFYTSKIPFLPSYTSICLDTLKTWMWNMTCVELYEVWSLFRRTINMDKSTFLRWSIAIKHE